MLPLMSKVRQWWAKRSATASSSLYSPSPWLAEALHAEPTFAGVPVDAQSALHSTAVYACVRVLSESVAALPLHLYRKDGDRTRKAEEHPLYSVLQFRPNALQTSYELRSLLMVWLALHGNAYAEIVRDSSGNVTALWPLRPDRMILRYLDGQLDYCFAQPGGPTFHLDPANVLHIKGLSTDGLIGLSPIAAAKQTIGLSLVQERFASMYFGSGARIGGILQYPGAVTEEMQRNIKESFGREYSSPSNFHTLLILEEGLKFEPLQLRNDEAQFLESRRFSTEEIARIYRVPPYLLQVLDNASYANISALSREFIQQSLMPWLVNFEQAYQVKLLKPS